MKIFGLFFFNFIIPNWFARTTVANKFGFLLGIWKDFLIAIKLGFISLSKKLKLALVSFSSDSVLAASEKVSAFDSIFFLIWVNT